MASRTASFRFFRAVVLALMLSGGTSVALADGEYERRQEQQAPSKESSNYGKDENYLPGEEVVTPTGKKLKVWSTKGPVKVSPPPRPFDDPSRSQLPPGIIVDGTVLQRERDERRRDVRIPPSRSDSFNVGGEAPH